LPFRSQVFLGVIKLRSAQTEKAIHTLQRALRGNPSNYFSWVQNYACTFGLTCGFPLSLVSFSGPSRTYMIQSSVWRVPPDFIANICGSVGNSLALCSVSECNSVTQPCLYLMYLKLCVHTSHESFCRGYKETKDNYVYRAQVHIILLI